MRTAAPQCLGAVLAGGLGRRLGGAKARVELAGRPLIAYPLAALAQAGLPAVVVAKANSELPPCAAPTHTPVITEPAEPRHPLAGIVAALEEAERREASAALVIACDMPFLPPALLAWLAQLEDPLAVPLVDGHPQPLAARYATDLLPALRQALTGPSAPPPSTTPPPPSQAAKATEAAPVHRIGSLTGIVMDLAPRLIDESELARFGDPSRILHNVNTAADLERSAAWLPARPAI